MFGHKIKKDIVTTTSGKHYAISTIHLPFDHGYGDGEELWYETMVFPSNGERITDWLDLDCERYETAEQAIAGHEDMKRKWQTKEDV